jgi:hypothetical protein
MTWKSSRNRLHEPIELRVLYFNQEVHMLKVRLVTLVTTWYLGFIGTSVSLSAAPHWSFSFPDADPEKVVRDEQKKERDYLEKTMLGEPGRLLVPIDFATENFGKAVARYLKDRRSDKPRAFVFLKMEEFVDLLVDQIDNFGDKPTQERVVASLCLKTPQDRDCLEVTRILREELKLPAPGRGESPSSERDSSSPGVSRSPSPQK